EASANITQASPGLSAATISSVSHIDSSLPTQLWRSGAGWVLVAFVLIIQWGLFYQFAQREVVWAYPTNHDQNLYLTMSYETYEQILEKGLIPGLLDGLSRQIPNG